MTLPKLVEGNRLKTYNLATHFTKEYANEMQDQLIAIVAQRNYNVNLHDMVPVDSPGWSIDYTEDPLRVEEENNVAGSVLRFGINLAAGCEIKEIRVWGKADTGSPTGGSIKLYEEPVDGGTTRSLLYTVATGNIWQHTSIYKHEATGLSLVLNAQKRYYVDIENATASVVDAYVYGAQYAFHQPTG